MAASQGNSLLAVTLAHSGSSAESVGGLRLGEVVEGMIEGDFDGAEGAETIGSSGGELGLVVETLDGAVGDRALGPEPVEQQRAMAAEHAGDFLQGLQARAPRPGAPPIQEAPRPGGGEGGSEELDVFL